MKKSKCRTRYVIYTDGSVMHHIDGDSKPGGWAAVIISTERLKIVAKRRNGEEKIFNVQGREGIKKRIKKIKGGSPNTTIMEMEMTAAIMGLKRTQKGSKVTLCTDSKILVSGMQNPNLFDAKKLKNKDLWQALHDLSADRFIKWVWVKGHSGIKHNETADARAKMAAKRLIKEQ